MFCTCHTQCVTIGDICDSHKMSPFRICGATSFQPAHDSEGGVRSIGVQSEGRDARAAAA